NGTTSVVSCDDGDPNTINDEQTILDCDGSICVPCLGTPVDCATGSTSVVPCDDNDPCTINDEQTILDANGTICVPCAGTPTDCANGTTSIVPCDDGDPNTINDEQTILDCDGSICVPCLGTPCNVTAFIQDPINQLNCLNIGDGVILDGSASSSGASISYEWIFNNNLIGTEIAIEVFVDGIYTLLVTDNQTGCTSSFELAVNLPIVAIEPTIQVFNESCPNEADGSIIIENITGGQPPYLYALNTTNFSPNDQFLDLEPNTYTLYIQDADGCESQTEVTIQSANNLTLDIGQDQTITLGESIQLNPATNAIVVSVVWAADESLSCLDCLQPTATPTNTTTYYLTIIDGNGCIFTDQITITVDKVRRVFIPNSFTPNQDGFNDYFVIYGGDDVRIVKNFRVFDRWGANVFSLNNFQPNDLTYGWDGTFNGEDLNPGVYLYYAEIEFTDGRVEIFSGDVTITK
ncbi:MAG: gliding motility-associated C-terminal domain-containing protein, partial [Bacteroidota bacterium]